METSYSTFFSFQFIPIVIVVDTQVINFAFILFLRDFGSVQIRLLSLCSSAFVLLFVCLAELNPEFSRQQRAAGQPVR